MYQLQNKYDFKNIKSRCHFNMEKLKGVQTNQVMTNKRKDEYQQMNKVKHEALCPYYAFEYPCPNLIMKDYCTF